MFCSKCGKEIDNEAVVCPHCGVPTANYRQTQAQPNIVINNSNANVNANVTGGCMAISPKSKLMALVLCIFLGVLGIHRFYVGKIGTGILWLLTGGLFGIGWIVDIILILAGGFRDRLGLPLKV